MVFSKPSTQPGTTGFDQYRGSVPSYWFNYVDNNFQYLVDNRGGNTFAGTNHITGYLYFDSGSNAVFISGSTLTYLNSTVQGSINDYSGTNVYGVTIFEHASDLIFAYGSNVIFESGSSRTGTVTDTTTTNIGSSGAYVFGSGSDLVIDNGGTIVLETGSVINGNPTDNTARTITEQYEFASGSQILFDSGSFIKGSAVFHNTASLTTNGPVYVYGNMHFDTGATVSGYLNFTGTSQKIFNGQVNFPQRIVDATSGSVSFNCDSGDSYDYYIFVYFGTSGYPAYIHLPYGGVGAGGRSLVIVDASGNCGVAGSSIQIIPQAGQLINGTSSKVITTAYGGVRLVNSNHDSNWVISP